jgi:hypothetical protein
MKSWHYRGSQTDKLHLILMARPAEHCEVGELSARPEKIKKQCVKYEEYRL